MSIFRYALSLLLILLLSACEDPPHVLTSKTVDFTKRVEQDALSVNEDHRHPNITSYRFGFDLRSSPLEDARQYQPLIAYLKRTTGYRFELVLTSQDDDLAKKLANKEVDFAAIGAVSFINARDISDIQPVVRGLNQVGKAEYQSVIVVRPKSKINAVSQLRGKRFAFGNQDSTQGHLIPRVILQEHGIGLDELAEFVYTGSHRNCANYVVSGKSDACGMQDTMGRVLADQSLLKIIYTSDYFPSSGIAVHSDVPMESVDKVRQALIKFNPQDIHNPPLYNWEKTEMPNGFKAAELDDYLLLREWMLKLGLLQ